MPHDELDSARTAEGTSESGRDRITPATGSRLSELSHDVLASALTENSVGVIITDISQTILFANEAVQDLTGYTEVEMLGRNCRFLQGQDTDPVTVAEIRTALVDGATFRGVLLNYRKDGSTFWNDLTVTPLRDAAGDITHFVSVQRDSSELVGLREDFQIQLSRVKREAETSELLLQVAHLLSTYSRMDDVIEAIAEGILFVSAAERSAVALWDPSAEWIRVTAQSGWPAHLADKVTSFTVSAADLPEIGFLASSGQPLVIGSNSSPQMRALLDEYEVAAFAAVPVSSHGELRGFLFAYWVDREPSREENPIEERLEGLSNLAGVALENAALLDKAIWNGTHDTLTELPDRNMFEQSLQQSLETVAATSETIAVLYLDIDRFKRTNDTLGHHAGDEVLRHVAGVLVASAREVDFVARVGGDEFVVVLSDRHAAELAEDVTGRIREQLEKPLTISGQDVFVSVSVGIAVSSSVDPTLAIRRQSKTLTATADAAMYRDKAQRTGTPDRVLRPTELAIDSALRGAVARGEITASFQPLLSLSTGTIDGVEALARWHHPPLGNVPAAEFIPIAEKNGVIHEIGAEILRQALALGRAAANGGTPVDVSVNASVIQLMQRDFIDSLLAAMSRSGVPAERITIEMTESLLITDAHQINRQLQEIQNLGMKVSLDDFGTGSTSLLQLSDLPITELKIDQAFVYNDSPAGEAVLRGIVELAHAVGLEVVVEGIETIRHLQNARRVGSDRAQGYHIAKPMSHDALLAWLKAPPTTT
ncbi:EAL domain-containing protein [Herbiconiux sp. P15]|uniref:sensor domain-containing protein n=1 Tax=Herbiconiux liukaitaii TaxID=3342799 RepID=UPI0035BA107F